jgi:transmembrane sensor
VIRRVVDALRLRYLERRAIAWVVRIDEDRDRYEAGLRRWVGHSAKRAALYNGAYRAFHDAALPARRIYGSEDQRTCAVSAKRTTPSRNQRLLAIGLSLLVAAAAISSTMAMLDRSAGPAPGQSLAAQIYATPVGAIRTIYLRDGSQVILDTDSVIRVAFTRQKRGILLEHGRARFAVAHDAGWPFVVTAGGGTVTARGTVFDVEAYRLVRVRLISGSVDVRYPDGAPQPRPPLHLLAGQQTRFDPTMVTSPTPAAPIAPSDAQWVPGMRTFDDVPVAAILDEVNRYSVTKIMLEVPTVGSVHVFMDLDVRDPQGVARNLALYLPLKVDSTRPGYLILRSSAG